MSHRPRSPQVALVAGLMVFHLGACGDGELRRPAGGVCDDDGDCTTGLCYAAICLDPEADDDLDGLVNRLELALGTDPTLADTDGDNKDDRSELAPDLSPIDTDGDGLIDAVESASADADRDCLPDETDARNTVPDGADSPLVPELCPSVGVCVADGATLAVMCLKPPNDEPACDFRGVPSWEADEAACDGLDNDCDGLTDEGCGLVHAGLLGHWRLDGDALDSGPYRDHGEVDAPTPAPDRFGTAGAALSFGAGSAPAIVPVTRHPLGAGDATWTLWARPDADLPGAVGLLSFGELTDGRRAGISASVVGAADTCTSYDTSALPGAGPTDACLPAAHWTFVAVVRSRDTVRIFLDGLLRATISAATLDLRRTHLTIGAVRRLASGEVLGGFRGSLDDVRLYGRALSEAELATLFSEGDWAAAGEAARPAQSCRHVRDLTANPADGERWLDPDGDGPGAPFAALCDQTTLGGGWTLAWRYGFTAPDTFAEPLNAVTPIPTWPAALVDVPTSEEPPATSGAPGAIPYPLWPIVGHDFLVENPLVGQIACHAADETGASLSTGVEGPVTCEAIGDTRCDGTLPDWVFFWEHGPGLSAESLFVYFDGSTTDNWPTHDPCGQNATPPGAVSGGAVWLR